MAALAVAYDLRVIHPSKLVKEIKNYNSEQQHMEQGLLRASLGNFGDIEYGTEVRGRVHYPISNQDGCEKFNSTQFHGEDLQKAVEEGHAPVIMIDRGKCKFVQKVKHV